MQEFIRNNRDADIRSLALKKVPEGVDIHWCLRQIEGYQLARKKLPRWAATEGLWYPPRLSMEQCSSEATALYKKKIVERLATCNGKPLPYSICDITGGFGVDFSYMAQGALRATYIEQQEVLCEAAKHNMPLLGLSEAVIINGDGTAYQEAEDRNSSAEGNSMRIVFADPARRDDAGRKTVAIEDCTPDICSLHEGILSWADILMVKLSPMLDITQALRCLHHVSEVHVVSVRGECKELLFVLRAQENDGITFHCVNLDTEQHAFSCSQEENGEAKVTLRCRMPERGMVLSEPNASILKAGVQEAFARHYALEKLNPMSNLYVSEAEEGGIPARQLRICSIHDFSKASLKQLCKDVRQANITVRNFPATVAELRKRLKIKEGGSKYLFATTLYDGSHALILCERD